MFNWGVSSSAPAIGFSGTAIILAGENNTVRLKCQRSRFLDPASGGTGVVCAGINNTIASGSEIIGYLGNSSNGNPSYAVDVRAGSITAIDVSVRRCGVLLKWGTTDRTLMGRIFYSDNVANVQDPLNLYSTNASLLQRSLLEICSPFGSSKQSAWGASGSVLVNTAALQSVNITGLNLPYVPSIGEVGVFLTNTNAAAQTTYADLASVYYVPGSSSTTTLSFRVKVNVITGANTAAALRAKLN